MTLPLKPPVLPQLAKSAKTLPSGDRWSYEPKWDGFRSIAFVDGDSVHLQSRNGKPLTRYFPELKFPEGRYILDGAIVRFDAQRRAGERRRVAPRAAAARAPRPARAAGREARRPHACL